MDKPAPANEFTDRELRLNTRLDEMLDQIKDVEAAHDALKVDYDGLKEMHEKNEMEVERVRQMASEVMDTNRQLRRELHYSRAAMKSAITMFSGVVEVSGTDYGD